MDVFVDSCLICYRVLWKKGFFCLSCEKTLELNDLIFQDNQDLPTFSLLHYRGSAENLATVWKQPSGFSLCRQLGSHLVKRFSLECLSEIAGVIPMPAKISGMQDHAYSIGEVVATYFKVPLAPDFIERGDSLEDQKSKSLKKRRRVKMKLKSDFSCHAIQNKKIWLLVDDIVTSGSTLYSAWSLLGKPPAVALTLASTPLRKSRPN